MFKKKQIMPKFDGAQIYNYTMDPMAATRSSGCQGVGSGQLLCSYGHQSPLSMRQVNDPAVFGRSPLSSGSQGCNVDPIRPSNQPASNPRCQATWSGFDSSNNKLSLKELDVSRFYMKPTTWSTGYHGMDVTLGLPSRLLSSVAAEQEFKACQNKGMSKGHYGSYGPGQ
jgi:hypothetical protein